jgi:Xaa-Pro aminopeptidase
MSVYHKRQSKLAGVLRTKGLRQFLVTSPVHVTYLTGFQGGDSYLWIEDDRRLLISDPRYQQQIEEECPGLELHIRSPKTPLLEAAAEVVGKGSRREVGIESQWLTVASWQRLDETLPDRTLVATQGVIEGLREVKDGTELEAIEASIQLAERAFLSMLHRLTPETTERQIAHGLEHTIRELGGQGCAFPTIVGVGPRAALPHGIPGKSPLSTGPFVLIDWGAIATGYCSDLTRLVVTGKPTKIWEKAYAAVLEAHQTAAASLRPGAVLETIDQKARKVLEKHGMEKRFTHGLGHGFGLQIHESPRIGSGQKGLLQEGMVVTIEPGVYFPQWGGIRIEDDYLITREGARRLTTLPQDWEALQIDWPSFR